VDEGGALRVGPRSAGAEPGPACYGRGTLPTVTDANLVLGRLQADAFLGGTLPLDAARAEAALQPLAQAMGLDIPAAALGVVRVVNAAMERAIRTISVERGHDPRDFVLVAFGGAGPLHAAYLAEALGMRRVLVPRYPGVLSALGMLTSDITRDYVSFLARPLSRMDAADLWQQMYHLAEHGLNEMQRDTDEQTELQAVFTLDLRYTGQSHEISTPLLTWGSSELARLQPEVREPALPADILQATAQRFHHLHEQQSGHALPQHPVESVALRLKMIGIVGQHTIEQPASAAPAAYTPEPQQQLSARLHAETTQPQTIARYERSALRPGAAIAGPAVIVQFDTTTIVPPGWHARIDQHGHTLLTI
jgi:N-methylhydantoinase A